jgi:hypothetical protein
MLVKVSSLISDFPSNYPLLAMKAPSFARALAFDAIPAEGISQIGKPLER